MRCPDIVCPSSDAHHTNLIYYVQEMGLLGDHVELAHHPLLPDGARMRAVTALPVPGTPIHKRPASVDVGRL